MAVETTPVIKWTCDKCGKTILHEKNKPSSCDDRWASFIINQDAGFDNLGKPIGSRFKDVVVLCEECTEMVIKLIYGE